MTARGPSGATWCGCRSPRARNRAASPANPPRLRASRRYARRMLLWGRQSGVVAVSVLAVPFAIWFARRLADRRRRGGMDAGWARRSSYAEVLMIGGTAPWLWLVMMPNPHHVRGDNLMPFKDLANQ